MGGITLVLCLTVSSQLIWWPIECEYQCPFLYPEFSSHDHQGVSDCPFFVLPLCLITIPSPTGSKWPCPFIMQGSSITPSIGCEWPFLSIRQSHHFASWHGQQQVSDITPFSPTHGHVMSSCNQQLVSDISINAQQFHHISPHDQQAVSDYTL